MLPDSLIYPMTANIYYATTEQSESGMMRRTWVQDRTIICSAIKQREDYAAVQNQRRDRDIENEVKLNFRFKEDITVDSDGNYHPTSEIMVYGIYDHAGNTVWQEFLDSTQNTETHWEIESIEPMFWINMEVMGYRAILCRSSDRSGLE